MRVNKAVMAIILACISTAWALAQSTGNDSKSKSDVRTITGCLSHGDSADEFLLTASDGSTWEVRGEGLSDHVGHTVTATGVVSNAKMHNLKEDAKQAASDTGLKKNSPEHGHMKITDVKTVSDSCQK